MAAGLRPNEGGMSVADNVRKICAAARPAIEAALDAAEELSEIRGAASEQGLDWSQVKAVLKAQIQDERDGGHRIEKLIAKADNAATYALMLKLPSESVVQKQKTPPQSKVSRNWVPAQPIRKSPLAASTSSPPTRGDEAVPDVTSSGTASPISEAAPALGVVGGKGTDAASSHSAVSTQQVTSLPDGGNLAGTETSGHSLSETDVVGAPVSSIAEPAVLEVSTLRGEIEPVREAGLPAGSPIPDIDPSLDIMNQPFYRGGETWPR
jgi:hypothetical protein